MWYGGFEFDVTEQQVLLVVVMVVMMMVTMAMMKAIIIAEGSTFSMNLLIPSSYSYDYHYTQPPPPRQGQFNGKFRMRYGSSKLPLKFKAWLGGVAPDYDSYTMIPITLGGHVENDCPDIGVTEVTPVDLMNTDWIDIIQAPSVIR